MGGSSRLGRLFRYSRDAQENFTTEALAIAIADDPVPIVNALRRGNYKSVRESQGDSSGGDDLRGLLTANVGITPRTQVGLAQGGWLDLVLDVWGQAGSPLAQVWIEVKINAPESGRSRPNPGVSEGLVDHLVLGQLDTYRRAALTKTDPVWLITLAREPVRDDVDNLSWNELYRASKGHDRWHDLRSFLKEERVASDALGGVSDQEAGSNEASYQLIQKAAEVVRVVHRSFANYFASPVIEKLVWAAEGSLLNFVGANFRSSGEMAGVGGPLAFGLSSEGGSAYWFLALRQGSATRSTAEIIRLTADYSNAARAVALASDLKPDWERPSTGPTIVEARIRATSLTSHEAVIAWFDGQLAELASTGVVAILLGHDVETKPQASVDEATRQRDD